MADKKFKVQIQTKDKDWKDVTDSEYANVYEAIDVANTMSRASGNIYRVN